MSFLSFIPYSFPTSLDGLYYIKQSTGQILHDRRKQLGMTQKEVADMAGVHIKQYQRLEAEERSLAGCGMKIGLGVCAALLLDPYDLINPTPNQPDPATIKPQKTVDIRKSTKTDQPQ